MDAENRVGEVLASKYRLEALLGSGGMGHVYRAVNELVGRAVAIKVLRREHASNAQIVERFLREARTANLVRHPNVVDVVDLGKDDAGTPFIVQELLEGEDLSRLVQRRGGKLPLEEVVDLLLPVIDAVAEAHARGVVHRDIKPENVFLAKAKRGPVPKLLDFGISKVRAPDLRATEVGVMMGTPAYMPPEQVQGARDADPRSDVWALGVMMFELIAGRMPFDVQDAPALFVAIATKDAPSLLDVRAEVTPNISRIVSRCLRRQPDDRYPSAAELARDLRHALDGDELEPTGKRSIPPGALAGLAKVDVPVAPFAPTILGDAKPALPKPPSLAPPAPRATPARASTPDAEPAPRNETGSSLPEAAPPAGAASSLSEPEPAPPPAPAPASLAELSRPPQPPQTPRGRLAVEASLPGVMLAPGQVAAPLHGAHGAGAHAAWGLGKGKRQGGEVSTLIGVAVLGFVVIVGIGVLMQVAHRAEGWPIGRFTVGPEATVAAAINGGLALVAAALGITYSLRALKHWRGELGGGAPNAVVNAAVSAATFFCAIELVSALY